ncbi:hypothetical protein JXI42_14785 [bacterium]|nr:hypothetical protein [bacterium]
MKLVKHRILLLIIVLFNVAIYNIHAEENWTIGVNFMLGGRYDDLRMCVGSPPGAKGGPIADIMVNFKYQVDQEFALVFNLPVMRPILFATAFDMLQFEPEVTFEFKKAIKDDLDFLIGPGVGLSLHYGPDYESDVDENRGESFFAAGPFISSLFAFNFQNSAEKDRIVGARAFYVPLFSKERAPGTVLGLALEGSIYF